jgi:threonine dehydrogenase-like Zn-dependent dehydrogenase
MIVDTTGVVGTQVLSQLTSGGYLMLVGLRDGTSTFNPKEVVDRSLKIIGSIDSLGTFSTAHYLIEQQIVPAKKIITHSYPLEDYREAFLTLGCNINERTLQPSSQAIKVVLQSNGSGN